MVNSVEHYKVKDTTILHTLAHEAGTVTLLNGIAQGPDYDERNGRVVKLKDLQLRWFYKYGGGPAASAEALTLSVFIIEDKRPASVNPNITEIFQEDHPLSYSNVNHAGRFRTLYKSTVLVGPTNGGQGNPNYGGIPWDDVYRKLGVRCRFDNTGGSLVDLGDRAIYLVTLCSFHDGAAPAEPHYVQARTRLKFTDM